MENKISYKLKRSKRAKRMRLAVYCDGSVVVTLPQNASVNIIDNFLREKMSWVLDKVAFFKQIKNPFLSKLGDGDYLKYKNKALELATSRIKFFNKFYQVSFNKINIRNQKTRWGSCSTKGNLNFNYKILFLSEKARDYIVVHEMCHLKQFNHSKKFWNLVETSLPDYVEIKKELRKNYLLM